MNIQEYQILAARTLIDKPDRTYTAEELSMMWLSLAAMKYFGAIMDNIKKGVFHQHGINVKAISEDGYLVQGYIEGLVGIAEKRITIDAADDYGTLNLNDQQTMLLWSLLGMFGEPGEIADLILDSVVNGTLLDMEKLEKELGDTSWYVFAEATTAGIPMSSALLKNITKLQRRYPNGYSSADSINRKVEEE